MKPLLFLNIVIFYAIANLSCSKKTDDNYSDDANCSAAKIIHVSCGGTVLQFIDSENTGEEWTDFRTKEVYTNCVLAGNIPAKMQNEGDTLHFSYKKVIFFSDGNFCDIGGLPNTKIETQKFFNKNCLK